MPTLMRFLRRTLLTLLAAVFLVEAWLWDHLGPVVRAVVARLPFKALKAAIAQQIERLPPYPSLLLFAVPGAVLFPVKLLSFWLVAQGQFVAAGGVFLAAKLVGFGFTAFIFEASKPKLMQLAWFARLYGWVLTARDWAHALVDPHLAWLRRKLALFRRENRARLTAVLARLRRRIARRRAAGG